MGKVREPIVKQDSMFLSGISKIPRVLFTNCLLIDMQTLTAKPKHSVLVEEGIITQVVSGTLNVDSSVIHFDLKGMAIMPGLIDAHVHVTAPKLDLLNEDIPESEIAINAAIFLKNMLLRGFTSVRDAGGADLGLANALNKGLIAGPRLFYSGKALSQTGGHGDFRKPNIGGGRKLEQCACSGSNISIIADGISEVRQAVRDQIRKGATQIKIMASGGVASPTDRITNLQYSLEEIKAIVEEASNAGTYVMAHAYTAAEIIRCVECGVRSIEHGNLIDDLAAKKIAQYGAYLVPTLVTYEALFELGEKLGFPQESINKINDVRADGLEAIKIAKKHKVKLGFGSDLLGPEAHLWQNKEFAIRSRVEPIADVLQSATLINAEILNHAGKLGIIKKDAFADLLIVDGNPLEDVNLLSGQGEHLKLIMKSGVIYKNIL